MVCIFMVQDDSEQGRKRKVRSILEFETFVRNLLHLVLADKVLTTENILSGSKINYFNNFLGGSLLFASSFVLEYLGAIRDLSSIGQPKRFCILPLMIGRSNGRRTCFRKWVFTPLTWAPLLQMTLNLGRFTRRPSCLVSKRLDLSSLLRVKSRTDHSSS